MPTLKDVSKPLSRFPIASNTHACCCFYVVKTTTSMCDLETLEKWLKAVLMDEGHSFPTTVGPPKRKKILPLLANVALNGLDNIRNHYPARVTENTV